MEYNDFLNTYSIDFLSNMDKEVHDKMLRKFIQVFNKKSNLTFFDVGSNSGSFIETCLSKFDDSKIYAFEPHPFLSNYLTERYKNHKDINVYDYCVLDRNGICSINIPSISLAISSIVDREIFNEIRKNQEVYKIEKRSIRIDTFCQDNSIEKIDFIKIDVEGAEFMVINGCLSMLESGKIISGQFEVGIEESRYSTTDITKLLEKNGYIVDKILNTDYFFYRHE
jgi:FkbM family methyltransferase